MWLTNFLIKEHIESVHEGLRYPCAKLDYFGTTVKKFKSHYIAVRYAGVRFPCAECDYFSSSSKDLRRYIRSNHGEEKYYYD